MNKPTGVWLIAGGPMQVPLAKRIKAEGHHLILTDVDPGCAVAAFADTLVRKDTFDIDGNLEAAARLKDLVDIRACLTVAADCHPTVAAVCEMLGLHGISPAIAKICRHKVLTREVLTKAGMLQPRSVLSSTYEEALAALASFAGPAVIKATDNSGSRGFAYLPDAGSLTPQVFENAQAAGSQGRAIIEEALSPRTDCIAEQSVETLWQDGKMRWLNWVDRLFRSDLSFFPEVDGMPNAPAWAVEIGHINPAVHSDETRAEVERVIEQAGRAIGMGEQKGAHVLKADIMLTSRGPVIIELTPRLSGGWDSSASTPARGADFQGGVLQIALGHRLTPEMWGRFFAYSQPELYAVVVASISEFAQDCVGRRFALGTARDRTAAIKNAINNLKESHYVV